MSTLIPNYHISASNQANRKPYTEWTSARPLMMHVVMRLCGYADTVCRYADTVRTRIIGPCARTLDLPLRVRSSVFSFSFISGGGIFGVFFTPFPEEEISDCIVYGPIIRVLTVCG